jgi:multiple sugar transport system substrate-binding protein
VRRARSLATLVTLALLAGALSACHGAEAGQRVTLRFWAMGAEGEQVQKLAREFERDHPGVDVRVQQIPWTAAHEKLLTAFVGDATPDVAQLGNTWVPELEAVDALAALDPYITRSHTVDSAAFFGGIWSTNVIDSTVYGIPWYVDTRVIFYRTDLLKKAGYDSIPQTWSGWRKAMEALRKQMGPKQWPIFLPTNEWMQPVLFGLQNGSPLIKDGGRYGAFEDSAFRQSFDFYLGLFRDSLAPVAGNNDIANAYQEFARGTFAMWITGPWNIGEFQHRLPAELQNSWATAPLPGPTGPASGVSNAGGSSLVIFHNSAHKDLAWQLIEFLSRPDVQLRFYRLTGDLPASTAAWRDSSLLGNRYARAFYEQLQRVRPTPKVPEWEFITSKVIDQSEASIRGGVPADRALAKLDADVNQLLEKRRWLLAHASRGTVQGGAGVAR